MPGQKILVIDDSKVIRVRVREMLPQGNIEILEAKDGEEGLKLIREQGPNLIMLDFLLPKVSGWEVFQKIQQQPQWTKIPLVVMSGRKEEVAEKIHEPFHKHYFAFLEKPFEKKELTEAIQSAMKLAKARPVGEPAAKPAPAATGDSGGGDSAKIAALEAEVKKLHGEVDNLKKQLTQVITIIKQKLK